MVWNVCVFFEPTRLLWSTDKHWNSKVWELHRSHKRERSKLLSLESPMRESVEREVSSECQDIYQYFQNKKDPEHNVCNITWTWNQCWETPKSLKGWGKSGRLTPIKTRRHQGVKGICVAPRNGWKPKCFPKISHLVFLLIVAENTSLQQDSSSFLQVVGFWGENQIAWKICTFIVNLEKSSSATKSADPENMSKQPNFHLFQN